MSIELKKSASAMQIKEFSEETNVIKGYASTFGGEPDAYGDIIVSGAFEKTIREDGNRVKFLFGHDWSSIIGKVTKMYEDERGLFIEAKISDTEQGRDFMTLVKDGVIDRMSIGYTATKWKFDNDGHCHLEEIKLFEVSGVGLPANDRAVITSAKELQREKDAQQSRELTAMEDRIKQMIADGVKEAVAEALKDAKPPAEQKEPTQEQVQKHLDELNALLTKD